VEQLRANIQAARQVRAGLRVERLLGRSGPQGKARRGRAELLNGQQERAAAGGFGGGVSTGGTRLVDWAEETFGQEC